MKKNNIYKKKYEIYVKLKISSINKNIQKKKKLYY